MRIIIWTVCCCLGSLLGTNTLVAQHDDHFGGHSNFYGNVPHGHDRAGHLIDGFGQHIDGFGRHTGGIGVFENGARDYASRDYERSGYYRDFGVSPYYRSYTGLGYSSRYDDYANRYYRPPYTVPPYYAGSPYYHGLNFYSRLYSHTGLPSVYLPPGSLSIQVLPRSPMYSTSPNDLLRQLDLLGNKIPSSGRDRARSPGGGAIVLRNPRNNAGDVHYLLNNYPYTMKPGEMQSFQLDREWIVKFDNGLGQTLTYRLQAGDFDFSVSPESGWNIGRRSPHTSAASRGDGQPPASAQPQSEAQPQASAVEELPPGN